MAVVGLRGFPSCIFVSFRDYRLEPQNQTTNTNRAIAIGQKRMLAANTLRTTGKKGVQDAQVSQHRFGPHREDRAFSGFGRCSE